MVRKSALLIVDLQNDFCPGGALAVPDGDTIVPVANRAIALFTAQGLPVIASRDWHPGITSHFKAFGGIWPRHCIQGTHGAGFHPELRLPQSAIIISKGSDPDRDDYSAFQARDHQGRPLAEILESLEVRSIHICGLATDYCVRETALDGIRRSIAVTLLIDGVKGVDLTPGDSERALAEMRSIGVEFVKVAELVE
jgi:nicotinamidase/pyrazinamidase